MADEEDTPLIVPTKVLAEMLALSEVHVGRLSKAGTIPAQVDRGRWDLVATVRAYVQWLADKGRKDEAARSEEHALTVARRRRTEYLSEIAAMDLAEKRGDIASLSMMREQLEGMLSGLKGRLLPIGASIAPSLELATTTAERQAIIDAAIHEALDDLSGDPFSFLGLRPRVIGPDPRSDRGGDGGDAEASAEADPEPVG